MERIAQYLDDLEDLLFAVALVGERLRRLATATLRVCLGAALLCVGMLLAVSEPPLAMAMATLLTVTLLYRATVNHSGNAPAST